MQKEKFDMSKYADMHEEHEFKGKDGAVITVRDHIPYEQKEQMAQEIAEAVLVIHDESCVYVAHTYEEVEKYMIAKYYTNIDTDDVSAKEVCDFLINNEVLGDIIACVWTDFGIVLDIYEMLKNAYIDTYEDDKSLKRAIRTSFGFLFNGEDLAESMAKAENTNSVLMNALEALRNAETQKKENVNNGKLTIGGNVINFAKKE